VKFLTIDFTEEVTLQPFIITTQAIESQKQMIMWFAENLGVLNEKRCKGNIFWSFISERMKSVGILWNF
jgi:hypothetical protein